MRRRGKALPVLLSLFQLLYLTLMKNGFLTLGVVRTSSRSRKLNSSQIRFVLPNPRDLTRPMVSLRLEMLFISIWIWAMKPLVSCLTSCLRPHRSFRLGRKCYRKVIPRFGFMEETHVSLLRMDLLCLWFAKGACPILGQMIYKRLPETGTAIIAKDVV